MAQAATSTGFTPGVAESVFNLVRHLDDEELWKFVCLMHPGVDVEDLEDIVDVIISRRRASEPNIPAEEVFAEEDRRRAAAG